MAEPALVQSDKDRWCRERLDFVCAVVNGVDRDSLKAQLEICETDDEAEGLMQSLLWLQDKNNRQVLQDPRNQDDQGQNQGPEVLQLLPGDQNQRGPEDLQLLPENQYQQRPPDLQLLPENQYQQRPLDLQLFPENQYQQRPPDLQLLPENQYQQRPLDPQLLLEDQNQQGPLDLQLLPEVQNEQRPLDLQMLPEVQNQPRPEDLQLLPEDQNQEKPEDLLLLPDDRNQEPEDLQLLPEGQNQEEPEDLQLLPEDQNQQEPEDLQLLPEDQNQQEPEDLQLLPEDKNQQEPEDPELLPEGQNDPRQNQQRPEAPEQFLEDESDPEEYEDAAQSPVIPNASQHVQDQHGAQNELRYPNGPAEHQQNEGIEVNFPPELEGAVGGVSSNDELIARLLSDAQFSMKYEDTEGDERLARQLASQMETEREDTTGDEELARRLANESHTDSEDSDIDNHLPREMPEEMDNTVVVDAGGDARLVQELAQQIKRRRTEEDVIAGQVAFLANMFPDAEPDYLQERCVGTRGQPEAFEQLVEELLQKKNTEPQMSGYLKRQRQAMLTKRSSESTSEEDSTWVFLDPEQDVTANELHECSICYEEEILEKNMATCNAFSNYHKFCIDCIRKHVAALIGQGFSSFKCMNGYCEAEFSWRTLKRVMEPVVFQKIQERKQQDEITAAGIENLESCPFCNFMIIMPNQENKVLECLNPECLQESCRLCKEPSHIPFRCEEIEKEGQKDARTNIENQMAEAMIRECPRCKKRFIIEAGCNRMTCPCGAVMCYLCKTLITDDYHHFERNQIQSNKCPLWSNATELHTSEVRAAAARAKEELDPDISLVHDPTSDLL